MSDFNAFTRRFGILVAQYCIITYIFYSKEKQQLPKAYKESIFTKDNIVKITSDISQQSLGPMLVTTSTMIFFNKNRKPRQNHIL